MKFLIPIYTLTLSIIYLLFYFKRTQLSRINVEIEDIQSEFNILQDKTKEMELHKKSFPLKIKRYHDLRRLIDRLTESVSLDEVCSIQVEEAFFLVAQNQGICILYLLDIERQRLNLVASKKQSPQDTIKAKNGDIFDRWVLKSSSNLLVYNSKKDFRFALNKIPKEEFRPIGSVISCPLQIGEKFLGILRIDNQSYSRFSLDDLRLLRAISDLGAMSIENAITYEATQDLAIRDSLTGLFRRNYFFDRLNEEISRSIYEDSPFSLLMFDIDHFKEYNDRFGHMAGDLVLKTISKNLFGFFDSAGNVICRYGGEEFCVLLSRTDKSQAREMAENFRYRIQNQKTLIRRRPIKITVSCGIATFPEDCRDMRELLEVVDKALYKAKDLGRNRVCSI